MSYAKATRLALALCCAGSISACNKRDDLDGKRKPIAGLTERGKKHKLPIRGKTVVYDLYNNRAAALVHARGSLIIDCGTADFAKYVEGAYRSPWHLGAEDHDKRVALPRGHGGDLYFPVDTDPGGIQRDKDGGLYLHLRVRSTHKKQLASVLLNEKRVRDIRLPSTKWKTYTIHVPASFVRSGENRLRFYFRYTGKISDETTAAAFAHLRIGGAKPPPISEAMHATKVERAGEVAPALQVKGPSRISYYVAVPSNKPALAFAIAGKGSHVAIRVHSHEGSAQLWKGTGGDKWHNVTVDLTSYAGTVVRLDLVSDGAADWARPAIVAEQRTDAPAKTRWKKPDHIIIWTISSLRMDRFAKRTVPTPAFSRFVERAVLFSNMSATAPAPAPAHVALMTGSYPLGVHGRRIAKHSTTLAERFRDAGYRTALISGNGFVNDEAGFAQGFDRYLNPMRRRHPFGAKILWSRARRLLARARNKKTLLYIATVEPHLPYTPERETLAAEWKHPDQPFSPAATGRLLQQIAKGRHLEANERQYVRALYNAEVRDADAAFGKMLADLDKLGIAQKTAVVLVGDHGEELFERGTIGHGASLYEEVLHIPAAIALPGQSGARNIDASVGSLDLYATILDMAGILPNAENQGVSLLPLLKDGAPRPRPTFSMLPGYGRAVKLGRYKLIVPLRGKHMLFDLRTDPQERTNLMGTRPLLERYMRNVFGIGVAYQRAWSRTRWGTADNVSATFASDHGL